MDCPACIFGHGGAGFNGSHVCERFLEQGNSVVILDDLDDSRVREIKLQNLWKIVAVVGGMEFVEAVISMQPSFPSGSERWTIERAKMNSCLA